MKIIIQLQKLRNLKRLKRVKSLKPLKQPQGFRVVRIQNLDVVMTMKLTRLDPMVKAARAVFLDSVVVLMVLRQVGTYNKTFQNNQGNKLLQHATVLFLF